jgi:hypothetical protein
VESVSDPLGEGSWDDEDLDALKAEIERARKDGGSHERLVCRSRGSTDHPYGSDNAAALDCAD